jgi:hypothetical protein
MFQNNRKKYTYVIQTIVKNNVIFLYFIFLTRHAGSSHKHVYNFNNNYNVMIILNLNHHLSTYGEERDTRWPELEDVFAEACYLNLPYIGHWPCYKWEKQLFIKYCSANRFCREIYLSGKSVYY